MSRAYFRRYLKLRAYAFPRLLGKYLLAHLPAVLLVLGLGAASLWLVWLPTFSTPSLSALVSPASHSQSPLNPLPPISAKHVFIQDLASGEVLTNVDADTQIYPASTTKIVTGLVALHHYSLDQVITVTQAYPEGQDVGFTPGEQLTVENLLYALLIDSANDAAEILAENYPGGRPAFVAAMNDFVERDLGLRHTHFLNPTGLDETGHYSSAADLGRIATYAMHHPLFSRIVGTETTIVSSVDSSQVHILSNTNQLLGSVPGVLGIKTGFTDLAGESVITLVRRDDRTLVFVVMGSADRFGDTRALIDWAFTVSTPTPAN